MNFFELIKDYSELCLVFLIVAFFLYLRIDSRIREKNSPRTRDEQTGLFNERACIDFLNSLSAKCSIKNYAIVYFDIIRFGLINERYGMDVGNTVLREYARWLQGIMSKDEIVARQTGDRFIAVIRKSGVDDFISKIKEHYCEIEFEERNYGLSVSSRAGIFIPTELNMPGEEIISNANAALNYGKTVSKRNITYMTEKLYSDIKERKRLENDIPLAMANEEFRVYYQPKVDIRTRKVCGAEALVRWQRNGEMIPPGKFIPMLEQNDLMCDMDFYMLRHLCMDISKWIIKGIVPPTISVNFSRRNLSNADTADKINEIVNDYHVPKKMIEVEITETIDEFPISVLGDFVDKLHRYGFRVSVDDFGSGSSSLSLLREVTFDTLKIDKGFVDRAYAKDLTILNYIIKMAKALNVEVLAEGVERKEQVDTLESLGCDLIQGYYFDKPLPRKAFEERMIVGEYK